MMTNSISDLLSDGESTAERAADDAQSDIDRSGVVDAPADGSDTSVTGSQESAATGERERATAAADGVQPRPAPRQPHSEETAATVDVSRN